MSTFSQELASDYNHIVSQYGAFKYKVAGAGYRTAVAASPRLTGELARSWGVSVNKLDTSVVGAAPTPPRGADGRFTAWKKLYLFNVAKNRSGKEYAFFVEHGHGPGVRTPQHMQRKAIAVMRSMRAEAKAR